MLDSFDSLKQSILDHLDRSDLETFVEDFITLAESKHRRDIRIRQMIAREPITIDNIYEPLPDNFLEGKVLRLLTDPITILTPTSLHEITKKRRAGSGKPEYFTINNELEFDIAPDASYSGEISFYKKVDSLSDSVSTNSILEEAPDAYLYGALSATAPFLMDDPRLVVWESLYQGVVQGLKESNKQSTSMGPIVSSVSGSTP